MNALTSFVTISLFCSVESEIHSKKDAVIYKIMPINYGSESFIDNVPVYEPNHHIEFYVYGYNLNSNINIGLSRERECSDVKLLKNMRVENETGGHMAVLSVITPICGLTIKKTRFYICLEDSNQHNWVYQESQQNIGFYVEDPFSSTLVLLIVVIFCFIMSSFMSGLHIGLMSLDQNKLKFLKHDGSDKDKKLARKIILLRQNKNHIICSLVILTTLCNAIATVILNDHVSEWYSITIVTTVIVLFCKILPYVLFKCFPLCIGVYAMPVTCACMLLTFPLSFPLSQILYLVLGKKSTVKYSKERLRELLKLSGLPTTEVKIITGVLDLSQKQVEEVMTLNKDIFKIPVSAVMDFETISSILTSGHSCIPIYDGNRSNIVHVLLTKDLALLNPNDKVPVETMVRCYKSSFQYIPMGTKLDSVLEMFQSSQEHMALIVKEEFSYSDSNKHVVGLITFEDVIEEVFQMEINGETDRFSENYDKNRLSGVMESVELISLLNRFPKGGAVLSENFKLAILNFLSKMDAFSADNISPTVLSALLDLDAYYFTAKVADIIYLKKDPADYFVLILEGSVRIHVGREGLKFEAGPFEYFGLSLLNNTEKEIEQVFIPEFTVQALKQTLYLKITKILYEAALLATRFERFNEVPDISIKSDLYIIYEQLINAG